MIDDDAKAIRPVLRVSTAPRARTFAALLILLACDAPPPAEPPPPQPIVATPPPPEPPPPPTLPTTAWDCDIAAPMHTLSATKTTLDLDGTLYPDAASLVAPLATLHGESLALAFDGGMSREDLGPLLSVLARLAPRPPMAVRVAGPRHVPIAGIVIEADPDLEPAYYLDLVGARERLYDLVDSARDVPDDLALTGPTLVTASDHTAWRSIADGLARACGSAHLVEEGRINGVRIPTVTRSGLGPRPPGGILDRDIIRRIVRAHVDEIRKCYNLALALDPQARGRVSIQFTIAATGKVTATSVTESTLANEAVGKCIAAAVRRWTFPKPEGGSIDLTYPFVLEPG